MKSTIHQNISIGSMQITRMSNTAILRIGTNEFAKRKSIVHEESIFPFSLFTGVPGSHVPLHGISHKK